MPLQPTTWANREALRKALIALNPLINDLTHKANGEFTTGTFSRESLNESIQTHIAKLRRDPNYNALGSTIDQMIMEIDRMVTATKWEQFRGQDSKDKVGAKLDLLQAEMSRIWGR